MTTREHLEAELALVAERLDTLPLAHQADCPGHVQARRIALVAYQDSLLAQLSTALVHERRRAVEERQQRVDNRATTTRAPSSTPAAVPTGAAP